jgi:predicted GNAT family N-acyltransferase
MDWLIGVVDPESEVFAETVDLRFRELREPLGLEFTPEQIAEDAKQTTLALSDGNRVLAVLMLVPQGEGIVKIRQVAVDRAQQGKGLGRKISEFAEDFARNCGYQSIALHARAGAKQFYEKMDYIVDSDEFTEVGIPHYKMIKSL